jgi:hypothetical protein
MCLLLATLPSVVKADWMDGNSLYVLYLGYSNSSQEKGAEGSEASGMYFGYVVGVVNATDALAKNKIYCLPPKGTGSTNEQLAYVVGAYLTANPHELNEPAMALIYKALKKAFPCR